MKTPDDWIIHSTTADPVATLLAAADSTEPSMLVKSCAMIIANLLTDHARARNSTGDEAWEDVGEGLVAIRAVMVKVVEERFGGRRR